MEIDRLGNGEYFGLAAENDEVVGSLIDSLEMRDGLMSVLRTGYTMDPSSSVSGRLSGRNGAVGESYHTVEPLPLPVPGVGSYLLSRGAKRYELKNQSPCRQSWTFASRPPSGTKFEEGC